MIAPVFTRQGVQHVSDLRLLALAKLSPLGGAKAATITACRA
jgi:hypothetical protein